jgi:TrmH family RNA methyltransferase
LFCTEGSDVRHPTIVASAQELGVLTHVVSEHVAAALSETRTPQGVVAICTMPEHSLTAVLAGSPRLLAVLVDVADPGNAGTVVRVADAAGADAVVFAGTTVDPFNGKSVRASAGSVFHVPVVTSPSVMTTVSAIKESGLVVLAADGHAPIDIEHADAQGLLNDRSAWLFGHEVRGLATTDNSAATADLSIAIPIHGRAESLNLATAAAVCLYASARAHHRAG